MPVWVDCRVEWALSFSPRRSCVTGRFCNEEACHLQKTCAPVPLYFRPVEHVFWSYTFPLLRFNACLTDQKTYAPTDMHRRACLEQETRGFTQSL